MESKDVLSPEQIAELLTLDLETVYRHLRGGIIPAVKIGGAWRVRRVDIEQMLIPKPAIITLLPPVSNDK